MIIFFSIILSITFALVVPSIVYSTKCLIEVSVYIKSIHLYLLELRNDLRR